VLSHRRQSVPQSEAVPFSTSPYVLPSSPVQHAISTFKLPPTIDDIEQSPIDHQENADGVPAEAVKEHTGPGTLTILFVPGAALASC